RDVRHLCGYRLPAEQACGLPHRGAGIRERHDAEQFHQGRPDADWSVQDDSCEQWSGLPLWRAGRTSEGEEALLLRSTQEFCRNEDGVLSEDAVCLCARALQLKL